MARVTLRESAVIRLSAGGAGTAKVGPLTAREVWYPSNVAVSCTFLAGNPAPVAESTCIIYMGDDTRSSNFRDKSIQGSSGDSTGALSADTVRSGQYVWAVWTGGDALVQATLTVTGLKDV